MKPPRADNEVARAVYRERSTLRGAILSVGVGVRGADVDDVFQAVALMTVRAAERGLVAWRDRPALRAFLKVVGRRAALKYIADLPPFDPLSDAEAPVPTCEERYAAREELARLEVYTTPERWRVLLAFAEGESADEIGAREGLSREGVYSRVHKARRDIARRR